MLIRIHFQLGSFVDFEDVDAFWFEDDHLWLDTKSGYTIMPKAEYAYFTVFDTED